MSSGVPSVIVLGSDVTKSHLQRLRFGWFAVLRIRTACGWTSRGERGGARACIPALFAEHAHSIADLIFGIIARANL